MTMKTMLVLLMCLLLCAVHSDGKPTEKKSHVIHGVPLSEREHNDDENYDYDHEAFLGNEEAETFDKLPPHESKRRLGIILEKIDVNSDDVISEEELKLWLKSNQKKLISGKVDERWSEFDSNKDGLISWSEYKKATYGYLVSPQDEEDHKHMIFRDERRFRMADRNRDSVADKEEFTAFLYAEDYEHMRDVVVQEMMEDIDRNKDGFIDVDEYLGDISSEMGREEEPDWLVADRKLFVEVRDQNKDGKMDLEETKQWIFSSDYDYAEVEAKHLVNETDTNKDGKLTRKEVLDNYQVFVGSHVTDFGKTLLQHDEF
ncbi:hypothetical protein JOB18_036698 [Solea senegalensis]|uniref:Reticulocalbin-3 n=1 Tax=Solea senegalensis TaxID=28829 RepID=A0AAV6QWE1_SOLSE|nr:calumenin-A [Solea senegalensis]KAG7497389.1 calumenin-A isoform X1 [Solea senegalensis]KAG7497390.1 hypothetical protein JOB18_036698 [Solea senegalensis]KAG7497391.1 hypothetical protein JOB18_036698 [Solea senegalensis]KAG7497392.1 hypothetical protein JOB18_036698 [Solea senegalensis]KAG7497393.1 hypothetical protein JOB18_036698 [Solea senegalensis]